MLPLLLETLRQHRLIMPGNLVVAGVSGGADSLALLHALARLRDTLDFELHAATLDHMLRGGQGAADVQFVVETCQQWGIPCTPAQVDVRALAAERKQNLEAAARRARYEFFEQVAREQADHTRLQVKVAVAHHADDQAETILMHLIRGAGQGGVGGMSLRSRLLPEQGWLNKRAFDLIRPLLHVTRADIEAYCADNGLQPRHDATNDDTDYTRNYVRHEIMPRLQQINPQVVQALCQFADIARAEHDYVATRAEQELGRELFVQPQRTERIRRTRFRREHVALKRELLVQAVKGLGGEPAYEHVVAALEVARRGQVGAVAQFPGGVRLRVDYEFLYVERHNPELDSQYVLLENADSQVRLSLPGSVEFNGWRLIASLKPGSQDVARLALPPGTHALLRVRRAGERFAPLGMSGHRQKISEWMVDHKVPRAIRERVPLLEVDGQVVALVYGAPWTIAESVAVQTTSRHIIYFRLGKLLT